MIAFLFIAALPTNAFDIARSLCDEIGPRPAGSPAEKKARAWALQEMKALGLSAVHEEPVQVAHWQRGEAHAEIVSPVAQPLVVTALGGSGATAPVEAEVVEVANLDDLKKMPLDALKGKILFLNPETERARDGSGYEAAVGNRFYGTGEAEKRGAIAMLLRSIATGHDRFAHTGGTQRSALAALALSVPDADLLHRLGGKTRVRLSSSAATLPDEASGNVVGDIAGAKNEIVLLGAHLDSWDLGTGAIDDAAGVAIVLEAARVLAGEHLRRTVRVVLFANEEHGLEGAKAYAKAHEKDHIVAAVEADFGAGAVYATRYKTAPVFAGLAAALQPFHLAHTEADGEGGADVSRLHGVPLLDLEQDGTTYFDFHHSANDTLDKIDPATLAQAAAVFAAAALAMANF